ncbi:hypothetical protein [Nonomuraea basaltis]|nr:hypothetical protein [Nonomuraea basaltis]
MITNTAVRVGRFVDDGLVGCRQPLDDRPADATDPPVTSASFAESMQPDL